MSDPEKKRECESDAKLDAGELPEGQYILYSERAVPDVGPKGTWKVKLETECTTTRKKDDGSENSSTQKSSPKYFNKLILEMKKTGGVYCYDPNSKSVEVISEGNYFANGLELSPEEDYLLLSVLAFQR